jgi:erythromycin esterase-like protein
MIDELTRFLDSLPTRPRLLGLGEPTHGSEDLLDLRNRVFRLLVEHEGYRTIAVESDALAGLTVDAYVAGGTGRIDEVMATGFSHGFGTSAANREFVEWMRHVNLGRSHQDRLWFDGFDSPSEATSAASPRVPLTALHAYLGDTAPVDLATIEDLLGDDERWTSTEATFDASRSVGAAADARALRLLADDLTTRLETETPDQIAATSRAEWDRARLYARTATGLLRYHAVLADPGPSRMERALAVRAAMMAANLRAIDDRGAGPTLVFAHHAHLQRTPSSWEPPGDAPDWWSGAARWWGPGATTAATIGDAYAFLTIAVGSAGRGPFLPDGLDAPPPDTLEGMLAPGIHPAAPLRGRARRPRTGTAGYAPLEPTRLDGADGVVYLPELAR